MAVIHLVEVEHWMVVVEVVDHLGLEEVVVLVLQFEMILEV